MAGGRRRLHSNRDRSGVGSLDATLAASDAISKAVKTPSLGSAKFATDAGIKTQRVGAMAHSRYISALSRMLTESLGCCLQDFFWGVCRTIAFR
jgi:hypothetical protein